MSFAPSRTLDYLGKIWETPSANDPPKDIGDALVTARVRSQKSKSIEPYGEMIARFPDDPALYAGLLRYSSQLGPLNGPARPEIDRLAHKPSADDQFKRLTDTPDVRMLENAMVMGKRLEPGNAYFDWYEAVLRFRQERDADALAAIHRAAGKTICDIHINEEVHARFREGRRHLGVVADWMNPLGRFGMLCGIPFAYLREFNSASKMVAWHIEHDVKAGKRDQALSMMLDQVRAGGAITDHSHMAIEALIGAAIQQNGIKGAYRGFVGSIPESADSKTEKYSSVHMLSAIRAKAGSGLKPEEWKYLYAESARADDFHARAIAYFDKYGFTGLRAIVGSAALLVSASAFLGIEVAFGLGFLISGFWLGRRGGASLRSGPSRLSIWLLAVLPAAVSMLVAVFLFIQAATLSLLSESGSSSALLRAVPWACALIMGILVLLIAALETGAGDRRTRFTALLARLRTGCAHAAMCLLMLYAVTMIAAVPVTALANTAIDRFITNEVKLVWEYKMPGK